MRGRIPDGAEPTLRIFYYDTASAADAPAIVRDNALRSLPRLTA